ncbi:MAG: ATP-dependent DNA ligase [Candidatus Methanomethylicia archaeon]
MTEFKHLALLCKHLEETSSRREKIRLLSSFLKGLSKDEIAPTVLFITGKILPENEVNALGIGFQTVKKAISGGKQEVLVEEPLTIVNVYEKFREIAGIKGNRSKTRRLYMLKSLLSKMSRVEIEYTIRSIFGEMRHGVVEGLMLEAIAEASNINIEDIRRAYMLISDIGKTAEIALTMGRKNVESIRIRLFTPIRPMLADNAKSIEEILKEYGRVAFEWKYDGARVQIHKENGKITIFSRRLNDVTSSMPEIVDIVRRDVKADKAILEGEVVATDRDGKPLPFQELMRRYRRIKCVNEILREIPLKIYFFDILYVDGLELINEPYMKRWQILEETCSKELLANRIVTDDIREAEAFLREAYNSGHEGLIAKTLDSPYNPGIRGRKWLKIKPYETLDLAIVAADWGYGRRSKWLSDYYLAALNPENMDFTIIGKTFKGLTDEEFEWMTNKLLSIKTSENKHTVYVKPEVVVEVAFNEIQRSPKYGSGFALRFARILRIRTDKNPYDIDTIEKVKKLYEEQFKRKTRIKVNTDTT